MKTAEELKKEYHANWRVNNRDRVNKYHKAWRKENKERVKIYTERYWDKKALEQ